MRKLFLFVMAAMWAAVMWANMAAPGLFRMEKQPDGTEVKVFIHGDEWFNYETDSLDNVFERDTKGHLKRDARGFLINTHKKMTDEYAQQQWQAARRKMQEQNGPHKAPGSPREIPRVLVILVEFPDKPFQEANRSKEAWNDFFNKEGYDYEEATGSVRDYFIAQSGGKYKPQFDVVGPVTAPHEWEYYDYYTQGSCAHAVELVPYLCEQVDKEVDFTKYDSDNDGKIDLVSYIFAGTSYTDGRRGIWPHLSLASGEFDGKKLHKYCCANELYTSKRNGIGVYCHEFSHGLGFPDYYVPSGEKFNTTATPHCWSLMDIGDRLHSCKTPPNYSIFDKYYMGWDTPKGVLKLGESVTLKPSEAYVVTRDGKMPAYNETDTVYYLENRQKSGWDTYAPGHGLLIWQVIYSQDDWQENTVNKTVRRKVLVPSHGEPYYFWSGNGDYDTYPGTNGKTSQKLFNTNIYIQEDREEHNVILTPYLYATIPSLNARIKYSNMIFHSGDIKDVKPSDTLQLKIDISGNVAEDCELQYLYFYGDGSTGPDYKTIKKISVSKEEAMKGYVWEIEEPFAKYKDYAGLYYRVKGTATIDGKKKEFYSNVLLVQFSPYSVTFYPGDAPFVSSYHLSGEENIKIAEHAKPNNIYNVACDREANVSVIDGWVVLEKMPSTDVKIFTKDATPTAKLYAKWKGGIGSFSTSIDYAKSNDTLQLKANISGQTAIDFELQYMRYYGNGSKDADYITRKCWSVTKAEAIKGYEWKTEDPLALFKNCTKVEYRIKSSATINGKKVESYSNVVPVSLNYSIWFYPGSVRTLHSVGETNIKVAEHTNDCASYEIQCEQEAKVSVVDGWVVLEKMPSADVKIHTRTDRIKYYVYFLDYDGSILKSQLVSCGGNATPPADPSYKGMEFLQWNGKYTDVHKTTYVYAQYEAGTGEFVNIEMTEHTCIDLQPFTGKDYRDEVFAGNDQIALTGDHLTFRFTQESNYGGTVNFWWTQTFDSETNEPDFSSSVKTKVGTLTAEQAKARQDMFYTYDICNTSACVDEKTFVDRMAFKFVYNSNGTNYESKPMVFYIYYPLIFRFKKDDGIKGTLKMNGFNTFTNNMSQLTEQGEYEYTWIPARSQENVFYRFTNLSFQDINDCVTMSRLRYPKTWGEVSTDVDEEGNPYIIQMGFIDTIAVNKQSFHVEFRYRIKYEDETGYKPVKDEQTIACGEAAVEPSHEDMYLPFAGWFLSGKIDEESRWLNVTEDMYFQADYVYPPDPVYYTVTFVDKDGNTIGKPEEVLEFENAHPPIEDIPKFDGWHFIRWEGSYINITSDRTIQAIYGQDAVYWTVNYYNWDDEWLGKEEVQDGHAAEADDIYPYKTGHRFIGWDSPLNEVRKNMKVTAVFDAAETPTYKVTVIAENGSVKVTPKGVDLDHVTESTVLKFEPVPDEDYEFRDFEGYNAELGLVVTENTTVTAYFSHIKLTSYTVIFNDWNGDFLFSEIVEEGNDAKGPDTNPTREGYTFTGWSKPLTNITGDLIVIAQYEQNPPTDIDNMEQPMLVGQKMLRDGHLYILVNDRTYDATGRLVK